MTLTDTRQKQLGTAAAVVGLLATAALLALAIMDRRAVLLSGENGYRRRYAFKLEREAAEKAGVFLLLVAVGGVALAAPPPILPKRRQADRLITWLLIILTVWKTIHALWSIWDEYWVRLRMWAEERAWWTYKS